VSGKTLAHSFVFSTGFGGIATVSKELAEELELARWEIPGRVQIDGWTQKGSLRRAHLRFAFKDTKLQVLAPVAVWDR